MTKEIKLILIVGILMLMPVLSYSPAVGQPEQVAAQAEVTTISMDFKDADIKDVLRIISDKSGLNIIAGGEIEGTVTLKLKDVPWDVALDTILKTQGLVYERQGNIIRVTTIENLAREELETKIFTLNYANAQTIAESLREMFIETRGTIQYDERTNQVLVTDVSSNIKKIEQIIEKLDGRTPQVQIEAKIIETTLGEDEALGIDWQTEVVASGSKRPTTVPFSKWGPRGRMYPEPSADITYEGGQITEIDSPFAVKEDLPIPSKGDINWSAFPQTEGDLGEEAAFQFGTLDFTGLQATLEALLTRTDTNVLSNPRISTLNNQKATIDVGTKWPVPEYSFSDETGRWVVDGFRELKYGILLEVTPNINADGYITMHVKPEVSESTGSVFFQEAELPIIDTKQAEAQVMIKDGETLVIGGLIKDRVVETNKKIPILGDIPLLGLLFQHKSTEVEKRNLLIFLTPHVLKESGTIDEVSDVVFEQDYTF